MTRPVNIMWSIWLQQGFWQCPAWQAGESKSLWDLRRWEIRSMIGLVIINGESIFLTGRLTNKFHWAQYSISSFLCDEWFGLKCKEHHKEIKAHLSYWGWNFQQNTWCWRNSLGQVAFVEGMDRPQFCLGSVWRRVLTFHRCCLACWVPPDLLVKKFAVVIESTLVNEEEGFRL